MKKWIFLFLAMVLVINIAAMGIGCKQKAQQPPPTTEGAKPPEAPAPPSPATTGPMPATTGPGAATTGPGPATTGK